MRLKNATPKTNAGYIQCWGIVPRHIDGGGSIAGDEALQRSAGGKGEAARAAPRAFGAGAVL